MSFPHDENIAFLRRSNIHNNVEKNISNESINGNSKEVEGLNKEEEVDYTPLEEVQVGWRMPTDVHVQRYTYVYNRQAMARNMAQPQQPLWYRWGGDG